MKVNIIHPTKATLEGLDSQTIQKLTKELTYTNKNIFFQITKFKKLGWLKRKDPDAFYERLEELKGKVSACLLNVDGSQYWIRPGSVPYLDLDSIHNTISYPSMNAIPWKEAPSFVPHDYQLESVRRLLQVKHGNISLPTGSGKSFILLMLAREMGLNTTIVTPSQSIFNELLVEFTKRLGKKNVGGYGDGKKQLGKRITIAIGKSLTMLKPGTDAHRWFSEHQQAMEVDESHTFGADQLENVCHGVLANIPYRFFVSATQTRNDGAEKRLHSIIGETVLEMSLSEAIQKKYLCPLNFMIYRTFSPSSLDIKDPIENKREHFLYNTNIADFYAKLANASWEVKQESSLILVEELRQITMLKDRLKVPFAYVHATKKKEDLRRWKLEKTNLQEQVDKFNSGEVKVLVGTRCIATGTNLFPTHNALNWVGGSSEIITKQGIMGRSTRILEKSDYAHLHKPKPFTRIVDCAVDKQPGQLAQLKKRISWYKEAGGEIRVI